MIIRCKMCGGTLHINEKQSVATCEYCLTEQTLPHIDSEKKAVLYDRANYCRLSNDFDKAMEIYEQILQEDTSDAETYWSLVLCNYGIEYVEDPATGKRMPTVNRMQFQSVFDDANYKMAIKYAYPSQRILYENEARVINDIQKRILAISQREKPFDVFICYKENDNNGQRTRDSVLAYDLYDKLVQDGLKVFYARVTLEDKLGVAYEPYIFAALNSAKVMVAVGTSPKNFNAVWVKNEWSRFLGIVKKSGGKKLLIPAYMDMDPYDLPQEMACFQAQDMSKIGAMQDLIHVIRKIVHYDDMPANDKKTDDKNTETVNLEKRAFFLLEDGDWERANEYCERILDQDPENAKAYIGKLCIDMKLKGIKALDKCSESVLNNKNYLKAIRFADSKFRAELEPLITENTYRSAVKYEQEGTKASCKKAMDLYVLIPKYKDVDKRLDYCKKILNNSVTGSDSIYNQACKLLNSSEHENVEKARDMFLKIPDWKDSRAKIQQCDAFFRQKELEKRNQFFNDSSKGRYPNYDLDIVTEDEQDKKSNKKSKNVSGGCLGSVFSVLYTALVRILLCAVIAIVCVSVFVFIQGL